MDSAPARVRGSDAQAWALQPPPAATRSPEEKDPSRFSGPAALFVLCLFLLVFGLGFISRKMRRLLRSREASRLFEDQRAHFDRLLQYYLPYYRQLPAGLKDRFLLRTLTFMENKEFKYVDLQPEEIMPLLISATAVQLCFGLEHYLLDFFPRIYVLRHAYQYGDYNVPFEGHVNTEGIYLSWTHFSRELSDYTDGSNVGLHEMAHALALVNFPAQEGADPDFKKRFVAFSAVARPLFEKLKQEGQSGFLGNYALTDYHEFWAVCIEHFFERSAAFRLAYPDLYEALAQLLNQDPLRAELLIRPPQEA